MSIPSSFEDAYVKVWFDEQDPSAMKEGQSFFEDWKEHTSAKHAEPTHFALYALQKLYPKHSIVMTSDNRINLLNYPGAVKIPVKASPLVTSLFFIPLPRSASPKPGVVVDVVELGAFHVAWQQYDMLLYLVKCPQGGFGGYAIQQYLIIDGSEEVARALLTEAGIFADSLHNEVWTFDSGYWQKSASLWQEAQKANWADVILKENFKNAFRKDIYGFFKSEQMYKELSIPWKRGIIMHGPPGNGKTISIKAVIKECDAKGLNPLYVKSFHSWMGEEGAMSEVFGKARQLAPCVVILEDLDSLINDGNRSFFLNQLDGLEGNDGLLVIATTNHFDRLDPGLSSRPSRFDRKFLFNDPDEEDRALYANYWQRKLESNKDISFPDDLVEEVAKTTDRFSFAYLKEAFVSALVTLAGIEEEKPTFASVLRGQIETLRKQLDNSDSTCFQSPAPSSASQQARPASDIRSIFNRMAATSISPLAKYRRDFAIPRSASSVPPSFTTQESDICRLMDELARSRTSPTQDQLNGSLSAPGILYTPGARDTRRILESTASEDQSRIFVSSSPGSGI